MTRRKCFLMAGTWSDSAVSCHLRALAQELAKRGHAVVLLVDKQQHLAADHRGNPAVYVWPSTRPTKLRDALFLVKLVRRFRPDCMVGMFGSTNLMLLVGSLLRVRCRGAWYLTLAEAIELDAQKPLWRSKLKMLRKRMLYRLATHILPNSYAGSRDVQLVYHVPASKCYVHYLSLPDPGTPLELGADRPRRGAICVGRLHPTKGQDVLIRALADLKERVPQLVCEFVGDGPCMEACMQLAADLKVDGQCRFVGRLSHDEVLRRMAGASVSVVPSRSECFGLVNLESLAMGTPVVATRVGGIGEIFQDGQEGFLVRANDPVSLADRLATLLRDPELQAQMSHQALKRFRMFEQSTVIAAQADWFEAITEKPACAAQAGLGNPV